MLARSLTISCFTLATSSAFAGSASSAGCRVGDHHLEPVEGRAHLGMQGAFGLGRHRGI